MDASMKRPNDLPMIMAAQNNEGKVVVITGVARGLGRAMALEFAAQGHRVAGCSRNEKKPVSNTHLTLQTIYSL